MLTFNIESFGMVIRWVLYKFKIWWTFFPKGKHFYTFNIHVWDLLYNLSNKILSLGSVFYTVGINPKSNRTFNCISTVLSSAHQATLSCGKIPNSFLFSPWASDSHSLLSAENVRFIVLRAHAGPCDDFIPNYNYLQHLYQEHCLLCCLFFHDRRSQFLPGFSKRKRAK